MGEFLLLLSLAVIVSFFAFREGKNPTKQSSYNSMGFAKTGLLKDKSKKNIEEFNRSHSIKTSSNINTVYVFVSSKKYHKEGCRFADKNSDPVSIESAKSRKLSPCKICNPHKD